MSEASKQAVDQTLHALWGFSTGLLPFLAAWGLGWAGALVGGILSASSVAFWLWREVYQWTDEEHPGAHIWWDPYLDTGIFTLAVIGGALCGVFVF